MKTIAFMIFLLGCYAVAFQDTPPAEKIQTAECNGQLYEYYASDPVQGICNYYSKINEAYNGN